MIPYRIWLYVGLILLLCAFLLTVSNLISEPCSCNQNKASKIQFIYQVPPYLFVCISNATGQGNGTDSPRLISGKIFLASCLVFSLLIFTWYSSTVMSQAAVSQKNVDLKSLHTMIVEKNVKVTCVVDTSIIEDMKAAKPPDIMAFFWQNVAKNMVKNSTEGLWKVYNSNYALITWITGVKEEIKDKCDIVTGKEIFQRRHYCIGMQKNNTLLPIINEMIRRFRESGVLAKLRKKYFEGAENGNVDKCNNDTKGDKEHILQSRIKMNIVILMFGIIVSLILCFVEFALFYIWKHPWYKMGRDVIKNDEK